jgi:hypothetical protein
MRAFSVPRRRALDELGTSWGTNFHHRRTGGSDTARPRLIVLTATATVALTTFATASLV